MTDDKSFREAVRYLIASARANPHWPVDQNDLPGQFTVEQMYHAASLRGYLYEASKDRQEIHITFTTETERRRARVAAIAAWDKYNKEYYKIVPFWAEFDRLYPPIEDAPPKYESHGTFCLSSDPQP